MEIGVCADCVVGQDLAGKMSALKALGYDFIEPAWKPAEMPRLGEAFGRELRAIGEGAGCPVRSAILGSFPDLGKRLREAASRAKEIDVLRRACATLSAAGGSVILLPNWAGESPDDYDALYADFLREAGVIAAAHGVKLGVEHIPSSRYRNTAASVCELAEKANAPNVGVYFDIANDLAAGQDPVSAASRVAKSVVQFHVKDYAKGGRPLDAMPIREVKAIFEAAGFRGRAVVEIGPAGRKDNAHLASALATLRASGY